MIKVKCTNENAAGQSDGGIYIGGKKTVLDEAREQRDQNNHRHWHTKQPKNKGSTHRDISSAIISHISSKELWVERTQYGDGAAKPYFPVAYTRNPETLLAGEALKAFLPSV